MSGPAYGKREDGTPKEIGYFGEIARPDGGMSSELSIRTGFDGRERLIPSLVPTLSRQEIRGLADNPEDFAIGNTPMAHSIRRKAVEHARGRYAIGKSPFAGNDEPNTVNMPMLRQGMQARALRGR